MRGNKNWEEILFPGNSDSKESTCNVGDLGSIPGLGRFPGGGHGNPLQYSCLENPTATVHGVAEESGKTTVKQQCVCMLSHFSHI